ncbi:STAS domain-containing protein [Nocardioides sp. CER19]|uniref:STAS domain-containing protein n=1 Tax=Nocardioides sp. CER19 TaxID=3038538 RepID=UPI00244881A6|nr:STAS domain-containing protein [Nocardioides sp. CER19]MDH2412851.1 STAS domain-containing protein [Nocardioides sp. CER19]
MTSERALSVDVEQDGDLTVVRLTGELDVSTTGGVRTVLDDLLIDGAPRLVVDLTALDFMDSAGLGLLVRTHRQARTFRGAFAVVCHEGIVTHLLSMTGLAHVIRVFSSVQDAAAAM